MHEADEHIVAPGTAYDRPHPVHVDGGRSNHSGGAAARAGRLHERHVKGEDRLQHTRGSVAIQLTLHPASPIGPTPSVLMRPGSYPSSTRPAAAAPTQKRCPQIRGR